MPGETEIIYKRPRIFLGLHYPRIHTHSLAVSRNRVRSRADIYSYTICGFCLYTHACTLELTHISTQCIHTHTLTSAHLHTHAHTHSRTLTFTQSLTHFIKLEYNCRVTKTSRSELTSVEHFKITYHFWLS